MIAKQYMWGPRDLGDRSPSFESEAIQAAVADEARQAAALEAVCAEPGECLRSQPLVDILQAHKEIAQARMRMLG